MGSEDTRADDGVWQRLQASTSPAGGPVHRHAMPRLRSDADTGELSGRPRHPQGVGWVQLPGEPPTVVPALQSRTWRIAGRSGHRGETCGTEARSRAHVRRRTDRKKSASNRFTCLLQNFLATRKWSDVKPPVAGRDSLQEAGPGLARVRSAICQRRGEAAVKPCKMCDVDVHATHANLRTRLVTARWRGA